MTVVGAEKLGPTVTSYDKHASDEEKASGMEGKMYLGDCLFFLKCSKASFYRRIAAKRIPRPESYFGKSVWKTEDLKKFQAEELKNKGG